MCVYYEGMMKQKITFKESQKNKRLKEFDNDKRINNIRVVNVFPK